MNQVCSIRRWWPSSAISRGTRSSRCSCSLRGAVSTASCSTPGNLTGCQPPPANSLCIVYPTISFRAVDWWGTRPSLGYDVSVDNIAPVADLDPPQLRGRRLGVAGYECSFAFDPLSVNRFVGDMPNDGCMVPQVFDLRARIEDDGNRAAGLKVVPIAGIDPDQTNVYVWHVDTSDPNHAAAADVDTDDDGTCDAINPLLVPTSSPPTQSNQVLQIRLAGVPPAGSADFRPDSTLRRGALWAGDSHRAAQAAVRDQPTDHRPRLCREQQPCHLVGGADRSRCPLPRQPVRRAGQQHPRGVGLHRRRYRRQGGQARASRPLSASTSSTTISPASARDHPRAPARRRPARKIRPGQQHGGQGAVRHGSSPAANTTAPPAPVRAHNAHRDAPGPPAPSTRYPRRPMGEPAVVVDSLIKRFGAKTAVAGLSFSVSGR